MTVPGIVQSTLDGEEIAARVTLGGDDELFVTPSRSIVYRAEGLLSDESVDEFSHDADRLILSEGRRKTRFTLEYSLDGEREFTVPSGRSDDVLHPVLAGVLNGNDITDPGETVVKTYRFSELTLIVTSDRLVKHIGGAVWDGDFEQYHFEDVTGLSFEDGSVATQIVLEVDGRPQRIKAPNDRADDVSERLKRALFDYHDVGSLEELNEHVGTGDGAPTRADPATAFGDGVDPLDADPPAPDDYEGDVEAEAAAATASDPDEADVEDPLSAAGIDDGSAEFEADHEDSGGAVLEDAADAVRHVEAEEPRDEFETGGFESDAGGTDPELLARIEDLEATIDRQTELLERQQETIERLIEELRRGR
ncbi:DUF7115 domain-containing protein [Salinilacihabitans rarus]|uniref:DUF7115 domain-containing protein n=1 Tax=Salinilacihabitans rarus TaxID=2961596 RepID=UPI0020C85911|nr:hypothetical protein [Salinilacihabitans rarus]